MAVVDVRVEQAVALRGRHGPAGWWARVPEADKAILTAGAMVVLAWVALFVWLFSGP